MAEAKKPANPAGAGDKAEGSAAELLKNLISGYLETANLQSDYQSLYRSLPGVFEVAGEILKRKEAGDDALEEGLSVVEKMLTDASEKADKLSDALQSQHATLQKILANKTHLQDVLRAGKKGMSEAGQGSATGSPGVPPGGGVGAGPGGLAGLSDPRLANQLNLVLNNIPAMVSKEVERHIAELRVQVEQVLQSKK